jgi:hypothetical protein
MQAAMRGIALTTAVLLVIPEAVQAAQKNARYSPAIERAYAARAVVALVQSKCKDHLTVDLDRARALQKEAGLGDREVPSLEATSRATRAITDKMTAAGLKHGMRAGDMHVPQNQCLALFYTFGPEGEWIKGLVAEKP